MINWRSVIAILVNAIIISCQTQDCDLFKNLTATIVDDQYNFKEVALEKSTDIQKDFLILHIERQKIPKLCRNAFGAFPRLTLIRLNICEINEIEEDAFANVPYLTTVTLSGNKLERIPKGAFKNLPVRIINLMDNHIKSIEDLAFQNLPRLEEINLSRNDLGEFDGNWFGSTPELKKINFVYNQLEALPENAFAKFNVNNSFHLWFMNNKIKSIHENAFKGVRYVGDLWLDNNNVSDIGVGVFQNVSKIHTLSLENNEIGCLGEELLSNLRVDILMISGNPLNCDCLKKMLRWVEINKVLCQVPKRFARCP